LRVEPQHCLVFEDTETGVQAARAAGMAWVMV
jgi:HAD superfamily hydrolase (TIGR01509 family)